MIDMVDIGKELCHNLRNGVAPPVVLGKLQRTGFAPAESAIILISAVNNMCLDTKAVVVGWPRDNGYTGPVSVPSNDFVERVGETPEVLHYGRGTVEVDPGVAHMEAHGKTPKRISQQLIRFQPTRTSSTAWPVVKNRREIQGRVRFHPQPTSERTLPDRA
jgi:hypothetical protein